MSVFSPLWFPIGLLILLAFAATPLFGWADAPPSSVRNRTQTIDGLRGFLALGVYFHHAAIYRVFGDTGAWNPPDGRFYTNLGPVSVGLFFMITGYLFWGQAMASSGPLDLRRLYLTRFFRIIPLYAVLAGAVLLISGFETGWVARVSRPQLVLDVARWLSGGLFYAGSVNGFFLVAASVTWTLRYEWLFYPSLSATRHIAQRPAFAIIFAGCGLLACLGVIVVFRLLEPTCFVAMFAVGMLVAAQPPRRRMTSWGSAGSALALAAVALALFAFEEIHEAAPLLLLGSCFALVANGASVFGLLLTRAARRLGNISYGIYLLQGPILFAFYESGSGSRIAASGALAHWAVGILGAMALLLASMLAHVAIERPGIEIGRRLAARRAPAAALVAAE